MCGVPSASTCLAGVMVTTSGTFVRARSTRKPPSRAAELDGYGDAKRVRTVELIFYFARPPEGEAAIRIGNWRSVAGGVLPLAGSQGGGGYGRGGRIRTGDHLSPRQVRCQTAPLPDRGAVIVAAGPGRRQARPLVRATTTRAMPIAATAECSIVVSRVRCLVRWAWSRPVTRKNAISRVRPAR